MNNPLPITRDEMAQRGWDELDVLLVTGDAYVDHPSFGTAIIGRVLLSRGYRVGVIAQPDWTDPESFLRLGRPLLFAGVSSGNMDSMVNHYTSLGRIRTNDAYTPGGAAGKRPDRAVLKYSNCIQKVMKGLPVVIGGIEASLRRVSHYDFWSDRLKKSILLDSKAAVLVYGMGEKQIVEIARRLGSGLELNGIPGTATAIHRSKFTALAGDVELPSHEEILNDHKKLVQLTRLFEANQNPWCGSRMYQFADSRAVVVEPPAEPLTEDELDQVYDLPYTRAPHPSYTGEIPAFTMIRDSITVVRGCSGGCSFCAIGLHQGKHTVSRSPESVIREVGSVSESPGFHGIISDLGGPTANLYGLGCSSAEQMRKCRRPSCLFPGICELYRTDHGAYMKLLDSTEAVPGVQKVFISSGIRHDLALKHPEFIKRLASRNISGHLRIAPEHTHDRILDLMRKPGRETWRRFAEIFSEESDKRGGSRYIMPYIIAAFPGCTTGDMQAARAFIAEMGPLPRQIQIFLPTPMTPATAMYFAGVSYEDLTPLRIPLKPSEKQSQKDMVLGGSDKKEKDGKPRQMNGGIKPVQN